MSDTPETDNFEKHFPDAPVSGWKRIARRFEREREELRRWRDAAVSTGLYRADTDISTPEKWQSAQAAALASLLSERDNLRRWKTEALTVMPPHQEIGQEIGVTLGSSIHDKILPELVRRREEIEILRLKVTQSEAGYKEIASHHNQHCTCLEIY